ncbi:hypothetical protein V1505DRAFT_417501 [Lipomyces doorenjongii]
MKLNPSITEKDFLSVLDILSVASGPYRVALRSSGVDLMRTDNALKPGHYDIRPYSRKGTIFITDEPCITRILSRTTTGRDDFFRARVRERDGKGFHAGHIFPLASEEYWVQNGFSRWITNRRGDHDTGINSCQNGLLMLSNIHEKFDGFDFSINPDHGYKIICFDRDPFRIGGSILDPICRDPNDGGAVREELLRWHFRQAVWTSHPGTDMMGEILGGPGAAKRMEAELFSRLNGVPFT